MTPARTGSRTSAAGKESHPSPGPPFDGTLAGRGRSARQLPKTRLPRARPAANEGHGHASAEDGFPREQRTAFQPLPAGGRREDRVRFRHHVPGSCCPGKVWSPGRVKPNRYDRGSSSCSQSAGGLSQRQITYVTSGHCPNERFPHVPSASGWLFGPLVTQALAGVAPPAAIRQALTENQHAV
jgi:hypothetical protein